MFASETGNLCFTKENIDKWQYLNILQQTLLNVIEYVWNELKIRIRKHSIYYNKNDLKNTFIKKWVQIPFSFTEKLIKSMLNRLTLLLQSKKYPTKY